jgi:hypothetical protein
MTYQMQEGYFTLEGDWRDRSINMLAAEHLPVKGANLTVTREPLPPGMKFVDYLGNQKRTIAKELPEFAIHADNPDSIDQLPAHYLEFSWKNQGSAMHQMVMVINLDGQILSLTATIPGGNEKSSRESLLSVMRGFRFGSATTAERGLSE